MFQLDAEIDKWCDALGLQGGDREATINELKDHLHREVKKQQVLGLDAEAAFKVATEKLGDPALLKTEFQKVQNGNFVGEVVTGLSTNAIRVFKAGDTLTLESSLRVPLKTMIFGVCLFTIIGVLSLAAYLVESSILPLVQIAFLLVALAYLFYEHYRGRTFLEITPETLRQQFRMGPLTLSDNIFATEFISELEAKRMLPGFNFGVCRVQFKYGSRIRAFNVGYYNDEAEYIIRQICETIPRLEDNKSAVATTNARSRLSNFTFATLALFPAPVYWRLGFTAEQIEAYYEKWPQLDVPASTELFLGMQSAFPWLMGYALLCTIPFFLLLTQRIKNARLVKRLERLLVVNGVLNWLILVGSGTLMLSRSI